MHRIAVRLYAILCLTLFSAVFVSSSYTPNYDAILSAEKNSEYDYPKRYSPNFQSSSELTVTEPTDNSLSECVSACYGTAAESCLAECLLADRNNRQLEKSTRRLTHKTTTKKYEDDKMASQHRVTSAHKRTYNDITYLCLKYLCGQYQPGSLNEIWCRNYNKC
ncbi:hypothetical protein HELRODRAFT_175556 [Helobdella robusta]|uniref:Apple domain-containing protein n=1 Tax=Helobdella robusta TaxID=6412 RepID=T1F9D5_HELRO|nr:hypothetical protein HELRODRAFT_175556 [Helobdella robusta]ESO00588.1 hypothetical protein HELRODRAFT_175556 [Helobdella robusta]